MREIKFRAWDKCKSRMVFFDLWDAEVSIPSSDSPIMQYIGLKDRTGREIYEGDIVSFYIEDKEDSQGKSEVYFLNGCFSINAGEEYKPCLCMCEEEYLEVIGNIYENGDLLK